MKVTTPEVREYRFLKPSTKPLDQKLRAEGKLRARAMRVGFQNAVKRANRAGVPLQQIVPVP
jgi:hypothetical protein